MITKQELNEWLHNDILTITFNKMKDNSERVMICTLQSEFLPLMRKEEQIRKPDDPDLMRVYDLEKHGWRSFRINTITEIKENGNK